MLFETDLSRRSNVRSETSISIFLDLKPYYARIKQISSLQYDREVVTEVILRTYRSRVHNSTGDVRSKDVKCKFGKT